MAIFDARNPRRAILVSSPSSLDDSYHPFSIPPTTPSPPHPSFTEAMMEENIENAQPVIQKWDTEGSSYTKLLFLFQDHRREAKEYVRVVKNLRKAMHFLIKGRSSSDKLSLAQKLMLVAMKRLEKEFYQILSVKREYLEPESVSEHSSRMSRSSDSEDDRYWVDSDEDIRVSSLPDVEQLSVIAILDLRLIADTMISCGYGKECVKIYKILRKSTVDEALHRIGIKRFSSSQINKMDSEEYEQRVKEWIQGVKIAVKMLFHGEKFLSDHVFAASEAIRESCFTSISRSAAANLFEFPEIVAKSKIKPERIFPQMELYEAISEILPEIESIFEYKSVSSIKLQVLSSLHKLGNSVQMILNEFEASINKNSSRTPVAGGGIHPLTNSVMSYVSLLANYSGVLSDIVFDAPISPGNSTFPEPYFGVTDSADVVQTPAISVKLAWIILVLLCKLDSKADHFNDIALSYIFLANNLRFILEKVRSTNLKYILGEEWISNHERKVKQYASNYESASWPKVISCLTTVTSPETARMCFAKFCEAFDEVYRKQTLWTVEDGNLRDEIKVAIARKLLPVYRDFYDRNLEAVREDRNFAKLLGRFSPEDLGNYLSDLFQGTAVLSVTLRPTTARPSRCLPSIK